MSLSFIIGSLKTGRRIQNLRVKSGSWSKTIGADEAISCTLDLRDERVRKLDLRNTAREAQTFLAAVETSPFGAVKKIRAAGPIWTRTWDEDSAILTLNAKGMKSYFDHRLILPLIAATTPTAQWTVQDPTSNLNSARIPNPALATKINDKSIGTIAKSLVAQARSWTGGDVPIILPADVAEVGRTKNYDAVDFKTVGSALNDLMNLEDGTEIDFLPEFTSDQKGVQWRMVTGTPSDPYIYNHTDNPPIWDFGVAQPSAFGLNIASDGSSMAGNAWAAAGNTSGALLVSKYLLSTLVNAGYPLLEMSDTSHSSVSVQATLDNYAKVFAYNGIAPIETWNFSVQDYPIKNGKPKGPQLNDYNVGDFVVLKVRPYDPKTKKGSPYITGDPRHEHRIVEMGGSIDSPFVTIKCAPLLEGTD